MSAVMRASAAATPAYASATSGGGVSGAAHASGITPSPGSSRCRNSGALVVWRGPGGSAPAPDDPPVLTERVVRGDHGASADREGQREGPVRRQRLARRQLTLVDQPAQPRAQQP